MLSHKCLHVTNDTYMLCVFIDIVTRNALHYSVLITFLGKRSIFKTLGIIGAVVIFCNVMGAFGMQLLEHIWLCITFESYFIGSVPVTP